MQLFLFFFLTSCLRFSISLLTAASRLLYFLLLTTCLNSFVKLMINLGCLLSELLCVISNILTSFIISCLNLNEGRQVYLGLNLELLTMCWLGNFKTSILNSSFNSHTSTFKRQRVTLSLATHNNSLLNKLRRWGVS